MAFPFFQREDLSEQARQLTLTRWVPSLELEGLVAGIDNIRHDVFLSPTFVEAARLHITRLIATYGNVQDMIAPESPLIPVPQTTPAFLRPPSAPEPRKAPVRSGPDAADFKPLLTDLLIAALNRAKSEGNISLDLLARLAMIKFLRVELAVQFTALLERLRARQRAYEGPRQATSPRGLEFLRERCAAFQIAKKPLLRKAGQDLLQTLREIEKETLVRMRRALFGGAEHPAYALLLNRLMFTEEGRDDNINAEHYIMLGNFDRDPDRFQALEEIAHAFLNSLHLAPEEGKEEVELDPLLNVPDNAQELVAAGTPDDSPKGKAQRVLLGAWLDILEQYGAMEYIIAAYETVPLLAEYSPAINAQQLKNALINRAERVRVEALLREHPRLSPASLAAAVRRVGSYRSGDRAKIAGRFLLDFMRYHRDLRSLEALNKALDTINLLGNERLRELSAINNTLYELLLPQEQRPAEEKVVNHVILKADIRDSTTLTRTLSERGLNPASYFSLNFYEPVNKLLAKYRAKKVFIEGDAVILALFGREGQQEFPVARTCVMAREMVSIVRAYNEQSCKAGLPTLELGIGISYQDSAPMYLMDGSTHIMISKALNESDRLSSCNKGARRFLADIESLFNVYAFKTVEDEDTGGNPDEFLMRYNVGGVHINEAGFRALQQEISLELLEVELPTLWHKEKVHLYSGLVPVSGGVFHRVVVREGHIPRINASDFSFESWTERRYYEVCANDAVYEYVEARQDTRAIGASQD